MSSSSESKANEEFPLNKLMDAMKYEQKHIFEFNSQDKKDKLVRYVSWRNFFKLNSKSHSLSFLVVIASALSIISNAIYIVSYLNNESRYSQFARGCDIIAFTIYLLEFIIKFISDLGYYFFYWGNIFNLLLLISFIIPFCITNSMFELAYLSFFRIFQITTYFRNVPFLSQVEIAHRTILRNLYSTFIMLFLLIVAIFLFSLIAYFCFATNPDSPLRSLGQSFIFLTIEATGGGWTEFQAELDKVFSGSRAYSILFIAFTYVIIVRGFVAFLADNSIVENRAYIKRKDDELLKIEESYKEIRPIEKDIIIPIDIEKENEIESLHSRRNTYQPNLSKDPIIFSKVQKIEISPTAENCKDLRTDINKFNLWQLVNIGIYIEPEKRNAEPRIYFVQIIVSFEDQIDFHDYKYTYPQISKMSEKLESINTNKNDKTKKSLFDLSDHSIEYEIDKLNKIKALLKDYLNNNQHNKDKGYVDNGKTFVLDFIIITSPKSPETKIETIYPPLTDFQTNLKNYSFNIYCRYVKTISYHGDKADITLPSELGKLMVILSVKLLGKKRVCDIVDRFNGDLDGKNDKSSKEMNLIQISSNDNKITEDKMLIKNRFWASSLLTVLKDYSIHNAMINNLYHKIFQRAIMMCDYMPITNEIREQRKDKIIKKKDIDKSEKMEELDELDEF